MNVLIVHAHPEPLSYNAALKDKAIEILTAQGHSVQVSDLYAMGFNPVGGRQDFTTQADAAYFKYQAEQNYAALHNGFSTELAAEQGKLTWADMVLFNFPLWWFSVPAILKGWVDRVFAMGFAYGGGKGVYNTGVFKGKKAMLVVTTGGPAQAYGTDGRNGDMDTILFHIQHGMLYFTGMEVLPPYIAWSPARLQPEERSQNLAHFAEYMAQIADVKERVYTNETQSN